MMISHRSRAGRTGPSFRGKTKPESIIDAMKTNPNLITEPRLSSSMFTSCLPLLAAFATFSSLHEAAGQCCSSERTSANQPRIVGGTTAARNAYPWMTALVERGQSPQEGQFCGGALIAPQWVLTASHCVEGTEASRLDVIVGAYDLRSADGGGQRVAVTEIVTHPSYGDNGDAVVNDVALLKLATPVTSTALPLVASASRTAAGQPCKAMGFGATSEDGSTSPVLLHVDLAFIDLATAGRVYPGLTSAHLAAGVPEGGRDSCQGDSGGPLVVADGLGGWMHAGVVSYGDGCARRGVPGIYANTLTFAPWIRQTIGSATPTPPADDHGNTPATATSLSLGASTGGQLERVGDVDVFAFTISGAGTVQATSEGSVALRGQILNSAGAAVATQTGAPTFNVSHVATGAGPLYLAVQGATASGIGTYRVTVRFTPATPSGAPEIELLGKDGAVIADGSTAPATGPGTSFGSVTVGQEVTNTFTIRNSGTTALAVGAATLSGGSASPFRVGVAPAQTVNPGRTAAFMLVFKPTAAGTFVADVAIANSDANENPYNFRISGVATAAPSGGDPGDSPATARPMAIPGSFATSLERGGDVDMFKFVLTASATVTLRTTGALDTYGTLFDRYGEVMAEADDDRDLNFRIRRRLDPGTYYLSVEGYDETEVGNYTLVLAR